MRILFASVLISCALLAGGCSSLNYLSRIYKRESRPGMTRVGDPITIIPAQVVANYFIVEVKWDKYGPWRFIVDTGSSVTLLSPDYVNRYPAQKKDGDSARSINVRSASGNVQKLAPANVRIIQLGEAQFLNVPVLVYDCSELTAHFGMKIDGILGFPLFRDTIFTLDYPQSRLVVTRPSVAKSTSGTTVAFNNERRAPIITVTLGTEEFSALIDSGSDGALVINPVGLNPDFAQKPRTGASIGTLTGDRVQEIGRLAPPLKIGNYTINSPIADITDQLSSVGGAVLKNYCVTFDSRKNNVTFYRNTDAPLVLGAQRSSGLAFTKTPAYWRVVSVVPGSPAEVAGVQAGDIVARIDGEPVSTWPLQRYDTLIRSAGQITFTFVNGPKENPMVIPTFDLVE